MVCDLAASIVATGAGAGVHTLLVDAGSELTAVRADHALGSALGRVAKVARDAGAHTDTIHLPVLAVGSARVRVAGVPVRLRQRGQDDGGTGRGGVTGEAGQTGADRVVVAHSTLSIAATGTRAGVATLLLHASQVVRALSVDETLRPAAHIWVSNVIFDAATSTSTVPGGAFCIGSTW